MINKTIFAVIILLNFNSIASISADKYNQILDDVYRKYEDRFQQKGANFIIKRSWDRPDDRTYKASRAYIKDKTQWTIDMWGVYPKHELATADGFTAFTCHEVGHFFAGAPYWRDPGAAWASAEGQADYYVTMKCLRFLWRDQDNSQAVKGVDIHPIIIKKCFQSYSLYPDDYYLCLRSAQASVEMLDPLSGLKHYVEKIDTLTPTKFMYDTQHPGRQCRLDTLIRGAICRVSEDIEFDEVDHRIGACSRYNSQEYGARANCWYLPPKY